jgi:uncharacterized membrane protein
LRVVSINLSTSRSVRYRLDRLATVKFSVVGAVSSEGGFIAIYRGFGIAIVKIMVFFFTMGKG